MVTGRRRAAVALRLARLLREHGSWCGETHLQKATYFLQELLGVPMEYEFVLYKYGPYAFDLHDQVRVLRARGYVDVERQPYPYGPQLVVTERGRDLEERFPNTLHRYEAPLAFVAERLGTKTVTDLEQLATALLVTLENGELQTAEERANALTELKPHVAATRAQAAVEEVDALITDSEPVRVV